MSADVLSLGGIAFTGFSVPERMGAGGAQAMAVHKLIVWTVLHEKLVDAVLDDANELEAEQS
jgi:hypothetical protein